MKLGLVETLISIYLIAANADLASGNEDQVHILNGGNFDVSIEENAYVLVMFHAPWCQHCENLKPVFSEVWTHHQGGKRTFYTTVFLKGCQNPPGESVWCNIIPGGCHRGEETRGKI